MTLLIIIGQYRLKGDIAVNNIFSSSLVAYENCEWIVVKSSSLAVVVTSLNEFAVLSVVVVVVFFIRCISTLLYDDELSPRGLKAINLTCMRWTCQK